MDVYEVRPRREKSGFDLISEVVAVSHPNGRRCNQLLKISQLVITL
jgi:hypothetical protein